MRATEHDDAAARLARALERPPELVEATLQEVGVDAPYLGRALLEGDPQGALGAVSQRLGVARRDLALAVVREIGVPEPATPQERRVARNLRQVATTERVLTRRIPRALDVAAVFALLGSGAFAALGAFALWDPATFRAVLVYVAAGVLFVLALGGVALAWRLHRAAATLRRRGR